MNKDNTNQIKDTLKQMSKKIAKSFLKKHLIIVLVAVILVIVLLASFIMLIKFEDGEYYDGDDKEKRAKNVPYTVSDYMNKIKFSGTEGIVAKDDKGNAITAEAVWDGLVKNKSNIENYLSNSDELRRLMEAQLITQYPKIDELSSDYLNGSITFERHTSDGQTIVLKYIDKSQFDQKINSQDKTVINYFTLDESKNLLIGYVETNTETLRVNDPGADISQYSELTEDNKSDEGIYYKEDYTVKSKSIPYINLISQYTMPFQYLWALLVISDDKDFVLELSDLVEQSAITISIFDNVTTYVTNDNYTYNKMMRIDTYAKVKPDNDYGVTGYPTDRSWADEDENNVDPSRYPASYITDNNEYNITNSKSTQTNTPLIAVTKADVWIMNMSKEYYQSSNDNIGGNTESDANEILQEDTDTIQIETSDTNPELLKNAKAESLAKEVKEYIEKKLNKSKEVSVDVTYVENKYHYKSINRKNQNSSLTNYKEYVSGAEEKNPKVDKNSEQPNFVSILNKSKYKETRRILTEEVPDWLFNLLEKNPDTVNMVELTKYLFYKVTNDSDFWSGGDFDFSIYDSNSFSPSNGGVYGGSIQEKVWFALKNLGYSDIAIAGAMGNIHYESGGFDPNKVEGGYTDSNGGIGICQWTNSNRGSTGRNTNLKEYAKRNGKDWKDEDVQVNYLIGELTIGGGADGLAVYQLLDRRSYYGISVAYADGWKNATTIDDATTAFCYSFERPNASAAAKSLPQRKKYAQDYYNQFYGREAPISINTKLTGESKTKMEQLLTEAQRIANDNRYTYSQSNRDGEYQYDCSSFVYRLYKQYFNIDVPSNTGSYGEQYRVGPTTSVELQPGDVLWRSGHVIIYIGDGKYVAANNNDCPIPDQISVYNDNPSKYTYVYRFITQ